MDTKTRSIYMLFTRDPLETQGHIQAESEKIEEDVIHKWKSQESRSNSTHIKQIGFRKKKITRDK